MQKTMDLGTLQENAQAELIRCKFSAKSIAHFTGEWRKFFQYAAEKEVADYTSELAEEYLEFRSAPIPTDGSSITHHGKVIRRHIRALDDFVMFGHIRHGNTRNCIFPLGLEEAAEAYFKENEGILSRETLKIYRRHLYKLALFLNDIGVSRWEDIQANNISSYITTFFGYDQCTVHVRLCSLRSFLRFFYEMGYHQQDMSVFIPKFQVTKERHVPTVWEPDDIKKIIACIDRGNPVGQRDYAIVLLATVLGMRVGDIRDLKFREIDWEAKKICYVQNKNQQRQELPLFDELGWALITYLQNGRPQSDSEYIFVRHIPPYGHFSEHSSFWYLIRRYVQLAGLPPQMRGGLHSLRHSLASTLLKQETPLPVISGILGHADTKSTNTYLKIDMSMLKRCAQSFGEEGMHNAR